MKKDIHPKMHSIKVQCVCGFGFDTSSTKKSIEVDICSHCHPFCTGSQKFIDAAGRIEKFEQRYQSKTKKKKTK